MHSDRKLPNLLVIGAAKSGTTSLYNYLREHPAIFMSPQKETHFLIYECKTPQADDIGPNPIKTWDEYYAQFAGVSDEKLIGEASPGYLCDPDVPAQIARLLPDARCLALLRNPIDRAYSSFTRAIGLGREPFSDMREAIAAEPLEERDPWDGNRRYIRQGYYFQHLSRYFEKLDRAQIGVWLYDDLVEDPIGLMRRIYDFLDVDASFTPCTKIQHNETFEAKNTGLHRLLTERHPLRRAVDAVIPDALYQRVRPIVSRIREGNVERRDALPAELRATLCDLYRDDIERLQDLLSRDLGHWLQDR